MRQSLALLFVILAGFQVACNKDKIVYRPEPPTPGAYFPVYPVSAWHYIDQAGTLTGDTVTGYDNYLFANGPGKEYQSTYYLSYFDYTPVLVYQVPVSDHRGYYDWKPFLDTTLADGNSWLTDSYQGHDSFSTIVAKDTTMLIQGRSFSNVIGVMSSTSTSVQPDSMIYYHTVYYARHVGIVRYSDKKGRAGQVSNRDLIYWHIRR
jgi:hypothetical protein